MAKTKSLSERLLPRRLRLVKLLRAHGVRDVERLREDELRTALDKLKMVLPPASDAAFSPRTPASNAPSSSEHLPPPGPRDLTPPPRDDDDDRFDDPHALPRFREPKISLPESAHTFLRLIPVDSGRIFLTWDVTARDRDRVRGGVRVRLTRLDEASDDTFIEVDLAPGGWYLRAPEDGAALVAALLADTDDGTVVLAESNPAIVPPARPAPPGPLVYATLSPHFDRRLLAGGRLLDDTLPDGVTRSEDGTTTGGLAAADPQAPASGALAPPPARVEQRPWSKTHIGGASAPPWAAY